MTDTPQLAIIGGSGLYDMPGLEDKQEHTVSTPFGEPSAPIIQARWRAAALPSWHGTG